jgi:hypothetical protein
VRHGGQYEGNKAKALLGAPPLRLLLLLLLVFLAFPFYVYVAFAL